MLVPLQLLRESQNLCAEARRNRVLICMLRLLLRLYDCFLEFRLYLLIA